MSAQALRNIQCYNGNNWVVTWMIEIFEHLSWGPTSISIWVGGSKFFISHFVWFLQRTALNWVVLCNYPSTLKQICFTDGRKRQSALNTFKVMSWVNILDFSVSKGKCWMDNVNAQSTKVTLLPVEIKFHYLCDV